jgi:hemoglobin/transferrin/lactoferrin receptor protein
MFISTARKYLYGKNYLKYPETKMFSKVCTFLVLFTSMIFSQDISLKGKVVDSKTGEAIQGVAVFISHNYLTYTNNSGEYQLKNISSGSYVIKISQPGYKTITNEISVVEGRAIIKDFSLVSSPIELDEVIVSTDRNEKYLRNSPYSELSLGKSEIENKPFQSLPDILKEEPGIALLRDGVWGTEISIRGLNRENVVTLIDGNRIATSTDVAARLSMVNMNDVQKIEVIKGASSAIYGSGATGGIVNIITKSPEFYDNFSMKGNISAGYNSVNNMSSWSGSVFSGNSFLASKFSGSYRKASNIETPVGKLKNSQFEDYSFSGSINVMPMADNTLKLNYQLFKAENVGIPGASVFPTSADVRYPNEKRELFSAGYEIRNISSVLYKLSVTYAHQFIERNVENIPHMVQNVAASGTTPAKRVSVQKITPNADHKNNNLQLQGNLLLAENNNLVLGLDYWDRSYNGSREKYQKIEVLNQNGDVVNTINKIIGESPLPDSKYKSLGVFAQDDAELLKDKLSLSLGARMDKIDVSGQTTLNPVYEITNGVINYTPPGQKVIWNQIDENDISYSGNVGLKYSASANLDLTLSLGLSFRSPSLEERFQYIDQGSYVRIGDPSLKPEKGKSADLGIRYYQTDLKFVSSIFFNYFDDLVTEMPGTFEGRNAYIKTNIGEARMYGFDLGADYNFYSDYIVHASASFVKGDDIMANGNLPEIPPLNGIMGIKFGLLDKLEVDLSSRIFTEQNKVAAGEMTTPGYAVFNFQLNTKPINFSSFKVQIFAGIENIFDKNYRDHLSTTRGSITVEPGRNFYVKLLTGI